MTKRTIKTCSVKTLAIFLSVLMIFYLIPATAYASLFEATEAEFVASEATDYTGEIFEDISRREENVKHFRLEDGTYMAAQYDTAVHTLDENGEWQDIDNTLSESGSEFSTTNARIKFAKKITGNESIFTLHENNRKITLSLDGAIKKTPGVATNTETEFDETATTLQKMMTLDKLSSRIIYEDILDGVDLEYIVVSNNVKENIIVKEQKDAYSYSFTLKLNNLSAVLSAAGDVEITDPDSGEVLYIIPAPVVYDANMTYASETDAYYTLETIGQKEYRLTVTANTSWMNASDRAFPVTIDPAIYHGGYGMQQMCDTCVSENYPTGVYGSRTYLKVGYDSANANLKAYVAMRSLPTLPAGSMITDAKLNLTFNGTSEGISASNSLTLVAKKIIRSGYTSLWTESSTNYNTAMTYGDILDYQIISSIPTNPPVASWNITSAVVDWYADSTSNQGIALMQYDMTDTSIHTVQFHSSDSTTIDTGYRPFFMISYVNTIGVENYYSYQSASAGLAGIGYVNTATGALSFVKSLLSTTDSLMPYTVSMTYNSDFAGKAYQYSNAQTAYSTSYMPYGFKLNINETIIEKKYTNSTSGQSTYYIWADADGTEHCFLPVGDSTTEYQDEDGLQLTLTISSSTCTITDDSKTVKTFTKMSSTPASDVYSAWYLTSITDKNNNTISFTFDNYKPTSVNLTPNGSSTISFITLVYNDDGHLSMIRNDTSKEAIVFRYSSTYNGNIVTSETKYLREVVYAHGSSSVTTTNWDNFYTSSSNTTNITVDAIAKYVYESNGQLKFAIDTLSGYKVGFYDQELDANGAFLTQTDGKISTIQESGSKTPSSDSTYIIGQTIGINYYNGYTEIRDSGSNDEYNNDDDIYTRYVFDTHGRSITTYSTNLARTEIYGVTSGEYENDNENAHNSLKVVSTSGGTSANYLLNGDFEKSDTAPTYWISSGNVAVSQLGVVGFGDNNVNLTVSKNTTSEIYQYVYLRAGDYSISFDINTFDSEALTIKVIAESLIDSTRKFEKEIPYNKYYASGQTAFDYFTFTANSGETFKISIMVEGGSSLTESKTVSLDNIMLAKSNGAQVYNMVQNGDFDNTSVNSTGATLYSPSIFWTMSSDSSSATINTTSTSVPFYNSLKLTGNIYGKQIAEQVIYSATEDTLSKYADGTLSGSTYPQVLKIAGFGKATSVVDKTDSVFALRLDVTYYLGDNESEIVSQYYNFCKDNSNWQYVGGSFILPADSLVQEIKICCEYSGNAGEAYFDDISVIFDSEGTSTQYKYDGAGRTILAITGNDVIFYSYYSNGNLHEKITRKSRTLYTYDSYNRLLTEEYYTYSGYLPYLAEYSKMIEALGTQTLKMSSSYVYNSYGLLTNSTVSSPQESETFVTQTAYNVDAGSKIFGSIKTTTDSLGKITRYFYNTTNGRLLANIQPDNTGTCYSYDGLGNLTSVLPATYSSSTWSDVSGSSSVSYDYNSLNQLEKISTNGTEYSFTYNEFGAKESVSIGGDIIVSQTYNDYNGKISSVTYANGTIIYYYYDTLARIEKIVYNNSGVETVYEYEYDSNGNLNKFIDHSRDKVTLYKYDDSGRMTNFLEYDSEKNENLSSAWYVYDDYSRISMIFYDQDYMYDSEDYYYSSYYLSYWYNENDTLRRYHINSDDASYTITPSYDGHNRIESKALSFYTDDYTITGNIGYSYKASGTSGSVIVNQYTTQIGSGSSKVYNFTYDNANANITKVTDAIGTILNQYTYDTLGRLTREDNYEADRTYVYTYDTDGNILSKKTYGFTTASGTPTTTLYSTYNYTYGNANWGDQLTAYRGYSITYDAVGNPTSYYNGYRMYMDWTNGNNLESVTKNSVTTTYTYNDSGTRTSKTVGEVLHTYSLDGSVILSEKYNGKLFLYMYDENGAPIGIHYREDSYAINEFDCYYFEKNFQGDIIGIFNEAGSQVAWYEYDAWGNRVYGTYLSGYSDIFNANPFRYRGYYYDSETGFYYCGSRYYDPVIGRFINADSTNTLMNTPMAYTDKNLYAYCDNNPVMRVDNGGEFWDTVFDVISLCVSVVDVVKNPDDPWAWVGLGADVVSLVVPFATGGGAIVKAATKADDIVDIAKTADKVVDSADSIADGLKTLDNITPDCFVAGTMIATEKGHLPIEDIKIGDYVWATDPKTGETDLKKVVNTFVNETTAVTHVTINGEVVTSTQTHPYYVTNVGWVLARDLRAGDVLVMLNGEHIVLELVQHEILESPVTTYNFEVEDFHTYYVGTYNVLVHNKCKVQISKKLDYVFGNATGDPHNIHRSRGLLEQVQSIGINDTPKGRQYMLEQLMEIPDEISESPIRNRYSSLLCGPSGVRQMDTVWENGQLITVYIFGRK